MMLRPPFLPSSCPAKYANRFILPQQKALGVLNESTKTFWEEGIWAEPSN
jgi:hypothetical protein